MPVTDFVADFLTVVRNASMARKEKVTAPASGMTVKIAEILKEEGFVENTKVFTEGPKRFVRLHLKYVRKKPAIQGLKRVSTPGRRLYVDSLHIPRVQGGLGIAIVSTSKGLLTDREARKGKIGGELICTVW
jgi:small subunit ribosomal protein S8